jgi:hypothetical protein
MKSFALTFALSLTLFLCLGQKAPVKFGDVTLEELKMPRYEKDTSASALILVDYGTSTVEYDQVIGWFKITFEKTMRVKIFKKEALDLLDLSVPLYSRGATKEKMGGLKVITYNLEKEKIVETKMKSDGSFEEKYNENTTLQKFTPANVKEGSVIEITYKINSEFLHYFRDWEFQSRLPILWSEYRANIPEYFTYERLVQGYIPFIANEFTTKPKSITFTSTSYQTGRGGAVTGGSMNTDVVNYQEGNFRWVTKDVPAFKEEPFMTTYYDYISKINFELASIQMPREPVDQIMGNWVDLTKSMLESEYFGIPINNSFFLKKLAEEVATGATTPIEKVTAIYKYVREHVEWNGQYRKFTDDNFRTVLDNKKGSSAEINLMLVAMLQKSGFKADPVVISTRNNGFVRENIAMSSQFNYVICQVTIDGKSLLLDATDRLVPFGLLPERCLNGKGYVISKESPGWVSLNSPKSKISASADVLISSTGEMKGTIKISNDGYDAYNMRRQYLDKGETEYVKNLTDNSSWSIDKSSFENMKVLHEPAIETYEFTHTENAGGVDILYINPLIHLRIEENPFKLENRIYPVNYGKTSDRTLIYKFTIPENYQIEEIPASKAFGLPGNAARYIYNVQATGNVITITSMLSINQPLFTQMEYPNLREFYNQVVAKQAEQIVLKKK